MRGWGKERDGRFPRAGRRKRVTGWGDRPGILPLLEDGDVFARAFPYVTTAGFTVTERVSFAVTVMPQAPPLDVRT